MLTTQLSLIARLEQPSDEEAWIRFQELYQPAILRSLRCKGLQDADAEDVAQQVMHSVSKALAARPHDPDRARFRTWLERVIRNAAINAIARAAPDQGEGGTDALRGLQQTPEPTLDDSQIFENELRKRQFQLAARAIEPEFEVSTWQAFWRTAVLGETIEQVAIDLDKSKGSIYTARSRIIRRLQQEIEVLPAPPEDS